MCLLGSADRGASLLHCLWERSADPGEGALGAGRLCLVWVPEGLQVPGTPGGWARRQRL